MKTSNLSCYYILDHGKPLYLSSLRSNRFCQSARSRSKACCQSLHSLLSGSTRLFSGFIIIVCRRRYNSGMTGELLMSICSFLWQITKGCSLISSSREKAPKSLESSEIILHQRIQLFFAVFVFFANLFPVGLVRYSGNPI